MCSAERLREDAFLAEAALALVECPKSSQKIPG